MKRPRKPFRGPGGRNARFSPFRTPDYFQKDVERVLKDSPEAEEALFMGKFVTKVKERAGKNGEVIQALGILVEILSPSQGSDRDPHISLMVGKVREKLLAIGWNAVAVRFHFRAVRWGSGEMKVTETWSLVGKLPLIGGKKIGVPELLHLVLEVQSIGREEGEDVQVICSALD